MQLHNFIDVFNAFRVNYRIFPSNNQLKHYSIAYIRRKRQNNTPKSIESASKIPLSSIIGWNNPNSVSIDIFRNDSSWMHYSYRIRNFTIGDHHIIKQSLTWALIMIWIIARIVTSHYCISCLFLSFAHSLNRSLSISFFSRYLCSMCLCHTATEKAEQQRITQHEIQFRENKSEITLHAHMIIGYAPHLRNLALKQLHYITYYLLKKQTKTTKKGAGLTLKL